MSSNVKRSVTILSLSLALLFIAFSNVVMATDTGEVSITGQVVHAAVGAAITPTYDEKLSFGSFIPPNAGGTIKTWDGGTLPSDFLQIGSDGVVRGQLGIEGEPNANVKVTVAADSVLTSTVGGHTMNVTLGFPHGSPTALLQTQTITLTGSGAGNLNVDGELIVPSTHYAGSYNGNYTITLTYTDDAVTP